MFLMCQQHGETSPRTSAEKEVFCNIVRSLSRDINKEENFVEAIRESHRVYASVTVSEDTSALLATQRGQILQPTSSAFSFLLRALELFLNSRGVPPLVGALPDMTSTTSMYTDLQQVYREQALTDRRAIAEYLMTTMRDAGCSGTTADPTAFLAQHEESIDLFCRNCARNLRMLTTRSVAEERQMLREGVLDEATEDAYEDPAQTPIGFYLALRSAETFFSRYQRQPGICASVDVSLPFYIYIFYLSRIYLV